MSNLIGQFNPDFSFHKDSEASNARVSGNLLVVKQSEYDGQTAFGSQLRGWGPLPQSISGVGSFAGLVSFQTNSCDTVGQVSATVGAAAYPVANDEIIVTFATPYAEIPAVFATPASFNASLCSLAVTTSTSAFRIRVIDVLTAGMPAAETTSRWNYFVVQPTT